eukprot:bmy_16256T0
MASSMLLRPCILGGHIQVSLDYLSGRDDQERCVRLHHWRPEQRQDQGPLLEDSSVKHVQQQALIPHWGGYISFPMRTLYFGLSLVPTSNLWLKKKQFQKNIGLINLECICPICNITGSPFLYVTLCSDKMAVQLMNTMWISIMKKHFSDLVPDTIYRDPTFCPLIWTTNTLTFVGGTLDCVAWLTLQRLQL